MSDWIPEVNKEMANAKVEYRKLTSTVCGNFGRVGCLTFGH